MPTPPPSIDLNVFEVGVQGYDDTATTMSLDDHAHDQTCSQNNHRQQQVSQNQQRKCFQCGQVGHQTANCISPKRSQEGVEAFEEYLEQIEQRRQQYSGKKKQKRKQPKSYHLKKVQSWWATHTSSSSRQIVVEECNNKAVAEVVDPENDPIQQIYNSQNFELIKSLHQSYGELFNNIMERVQERFEGGVTPQETEVTKSDTNTHELLSSSSVLVKEHMLEVEDHQSIWQEALNTAVRKGEPADFSNHRDNQVYAQFKLLSRTRYLHHLILDHDNEIAQKIRRKLILSPSCNIDCNNKSTPVIQVCSIGGGPGYDHLAICLVSWYLYQIQLTRQRQEILSKDGEFEEKDKGLTDWLPKPIFTKIFDLYHEEWKDIMEQLQLCFQQETNTMTPADSTNCDWDWWKTNQMTMHFGDLRCGSSRGNNENNDNGHDDNNNSREMKSCICSADIIVFSFVLHENSSFLLAEDEGEQKLSGILQFMLESAKTGAIIICMDSGNSLWPVFREIAVQYGWSFMSDAQKNHKIILGPKSFCLMERVRLCNPQQ